MLKLRLSVPADGDLIEIWAYIAADNPEAADRFLDTLHGKLALLAEQPRMGGLCHGFGPGLYRFSVGNFVIFYRFTPQYLEIVRVLHAARDIDSLLRPEREA